MPELMNLQKNHHQKSVIGLAHSEAKSIISECCKDHTHFMAENAGDDPFQRIYEESVQD